MVPRVPAGLLLPETQRAVVGVDLTFANLKANTRQSRKGPQPYFVPLNMAGPLVVVICGPWTTPTGATWPRGPAGHVAAEQRDAGAVLRCGGCFERDGAGRAGLVPSGRRGRRARRGRGSGCGGRVRVGIWLLGELVRAGAILRKRASPVHVDFNRLGLILARGEASRTANGRRFALRVRDCVAAQASRRWMKPAADLEGRSRFMQFAISSLCEETRATEHTPSDPFRVYSSRRGARRRRARPAAAPVVQARAAVTGIATR